LVSVCIPSYKQEAYIAEAIESVLNQSYAHFECVVIDDCSPDKTFELASRLKDPRLRVERNPVNIGIEGNWNRALEQARGKYVKLLCGDDVLYPRCLERQVLSLEKAAHANAVMACCSRDVLSPAGQRLLTRRAAKQDRLLPGSEAIRRNIRSGTNLIGEPGGVLIRAEALAKVGGFDGALPYLIDLDMWLRLLQHGDVVQLREPLFGFRVSHTQLSFALANRQSREYRYFVKRARFTHGIHAIRPFDALLGSGMSFLNMLLRKAFYSLFLSNLSLSDGVRR
jgi:glycosyltransferase involved in cell wall biosynthesis